MQLFQQTLDKINHFFGIAVVDSDGFLALVSYPLGHRSCTPDVSDVVIAHVLGVLIREIKPLHINLPACSLNQLNLNMVIHLMPVGGLQQGVLQGVEAEAPPVALAVIPRHPERG